MESTEALASPAVLREALYDVEPSSEVWKKIRQRNLAREWQKNNPERYAALQKNWKAAHPDYHKEWRAAHPKPKSTRPPNPNAGWTKTPTYSSWENMKSRCLGPLCKSNKTYKEEGVQICERWMTFMNFLADMGLRPEGTSIGRYGDVGNYGPGNCAWMTVAEQAAEKRKKKLSRG